MGVMKDSMVGDEWIKATSLANPIRMIIDEKTGKPNGNILSGPVRLAFCDPLFEAKAPSNGGTAKFGTMALYTPFSILDAYYAEYYRVCAEAFASYYLPDGNGGGSYRGLENPFHDQADKAIKYSGFTPGLTYINHTSKYQPQIVNLQGNIITDRNKVYPGVWAILAVNAYSYGVNPPQPKKGVAFGLQQVMIIADDTKLAGGAPDPRVTFAGVNIRPPTVSPQAAFGQAPPPGAPPPSNPLNAPPRMYAPPLGALPPPPPATAPDDEDLSQFV